MAGLVKHYQNDMQGIPQLTNAWGCMITLLDAILITGFNFRSVLSLSKASSESLTATIALATGHGFIARQVVRIKDSTNGWDGDFKVLSVTTNSITVECLASHPTTISGTAQVFTSPLDWEIVFSTAAGSAEPKRAYRSKSPDSLGLILLVHDFCVSGAASTGAKFAKVGLVSSMSDIDTITGRQLPYDSANPNRNWGWDGTYHGWAKWYYANPAYPYSYTAAADTASPSTYNRGFVCVGDDTSFTTYINETFCPMFTGVCQFFDEAYQGKNVALLATHINGSAISQANSAYAGMRAGYGFVLDGLNYGVANYFQRGRMWFDSDGNPNDSVLGVYFYAAAAQQNNTSNYDIYYTPVGTTHAFIQEYIIDSAYKFRGVLPFFRKALKAENGYLFTTSGKHYQINYADRGRVRMTLSLESL